MLDSLGVRAKLCILVALPILAMLFLCAKETVTLYRTQKSMQSIAAITELADTSGNIIHELQKERGLSSGFTAAEGKTFRSELASQRLMTNESMQELQLVTETFRLSYPQSALNPTYAEVFRQFDALQALRQRVDALSLSTQEIIAYYSSLIALLQQSLVTAQKQCDNISLYTRINTFIDFVTAKEFAGQERATLNAAFSGKKFSQALYRSWIERVTLLNDSMKQFLENSDTQSRQLYNELIPDLLKNVQRFRDDAFASLEKEQLDADAAAWFQTSTVYINALHEVELLMGRSLHDDAMRLEKEARNDLYIGLALGVGVLLLTLLLAVLIVRNIVIPIYKSMAFARQVADGQFDVNLKFSRHTRRDELGVLATALNGMLDAIIAMISRADEAAASAREEAERALESRREAEAARLQGENARQDGMRAAAERISTVTSVLSSVSQDISAQIHQSNNGAQEQSTRLSFTATAMEEMNATVLEVAQKSANAAKKADLARERAQFGSSVVLNVGINIGNVLKNAEALKVSMAGLGLRAGNVDKVLNAISDIADQTNLLALNAAIEAARAGEAGRGFAVVASEVRKLAEKTMDATREVAQVLSAIQKDTNANIATVEQTVESIHVTTALTRQSGEALGEIVTLVDLTTDQIRSIATAAEEQSATSEEITSGVADVHRVAEETAQAMAQSTRGVNTLLQQTRELEALVKELRAAPKKTGH